MGPIFFRHASLVLSLTATGCAMDKGDPAADREREMAIIRLEVQMEALRSENRRLEERVATLERGGMRSTSLADAGAGASHTEASLTARCTPAKTGYVLPGAALDEAFAQSGSMAAEARIVPSFQDGRATGFKLFAIKPDSFFASCGVKNGDVINTVNGMAIHSPDTALEAYSKLRDATRVDLALTRAGKPETVRIEIRR